MRQEIDQYGQDVADTGIRIDEVVRDIDQVDEEAAGHEDRDKLVNVPGAVGHGVSFLSGVRSRSMSA